MRQYEVHVFVFCGEELHEIHFAGNVIKYREEKGTGHLANFPCRRRVEFMNLDATKSPLGYGVSNHLWDAARIAASVNCRKADETAGGTGGDTGDGRVGPR